METLHSLHIADPAVFFALPERVQARHLAHVRNSVGDMYASDPAPYPDASSPHATSPASKRSSIDAVGLLASIASHHNDPPSPAAVENARLVLSAQDMPEVFTRGARETLHQAGLTA